MSMVTYKNNYSFLQDLCHPVFLYVAILLYVVFRFEKI